MKLSGLGKDLSKVLSNEMRSALTLIFILLSSLSAGGKYGGEFISGSVDARSLSLGNNVLTSFGTSSAVYFNPSYLPELTNTGVTLSHSERFEGSVKQEFAAYNTVYSGIDMGLALIWINIDDIKLTKLANENEPIGPENPIMPDGTVSDNEVALFLSFGKKYSEKMNWGGSAKLLYKSFELESASGIGFDVSGFYRAPYNIDLGLKIQDITTSALFWTTGTNEFIRPSVLFGAEYNNRINYFLADYKIIGGTKIRTENYSENSFVSAGPFDLVLSAGLELNFKNVFVRGGYNTDDTWSAGSGLSFASFTLDYAFRPDFEDLGNTHKASLSYNWK